MDIEQYRSFCLSQRGASEDFPFDEDTLVFRVANKIFALTSITANPLTSNMKCDPERAIDLRENYPDAITGGYHMNKKHWNTVEIESLPDALVKELVRHSYDLIVASLKKADREALLLL